MQGWLQANRLQLNVSKSIIMLIGSWQRLRDHSVSVFINDRALTYVNSTRYLGVVLDQHLIMTWKSHVNYILTRIRCRLYALNRLKPLVVSLIYIRVLVYYN